MSNKLDEKALLLGITKLKEALTELKNLDSLLTEIGKVSSLTSGQLKELGDTAFTAVSKYGKSAKDYLTVVREMYRAGYDNARELAELSLLAQSAGGMAADTANRYLMAADAAYNYKGNVDELNKILDSQTYLSGSCAVTMEDMADATIEAASTAAKCGVGINELSALIAAAASKTKASGTEIGTALAGIFDTLQDTSDAPVADALSALSADRDTYESLLALYSQGMGNAAGEAEKSAENIEGSLNRLSNTWTDTVENVANSDAILTIVNGLNGLLTVVNHVTDALGPLATIGLGAGLFAGVKNIGKYIRVYGFQN